MLTQAELDGMRRTAERTMTGRATVLRAPPGDGDGSDEFGSPEEGASAPKAPVLVDLPVRVELARRNGAEGMAAARLENRLAWTLALPAGTDVRPHDDLAVGARRFAVAEVLGPETFEIERRVLAEEVL